MGYDFGDEANLTNEQLAGELAKMTPLTVDEVSNLLPKKADKARLKKLIDIVRSAESQNKKLASFKTNVEELGEVTLKVLMKLLKYI